MKKVIFAFMAATLFSSCTMNKTKHTSGIIGCPESKIEITESSGGFTANTWTAKCEDRTFYCTYRGVGNVTCAESIVD